MKVKPPTGNGVEIADCMGRTGPQSGLEELGKAAHRWGGDGMCAPSAQAENDLRWTG